MNKFENGTSLIDGKIYQVLEKEGSENPTLETKLLLNHVFDSENNHSLNNNLESHLSRHIDLVRKKIPVQRQIGETEIAGLKIKITKDVLLPGPEIEVLIKASLENTNKPKSIIDLCTGCGIIAIALSKKLDKSKILATDISDKALKIAEANAQANDVKNVFFLKSDIFQSVSETEFNNVDLIVSNPPYCKSEDISKLPPQIRLFTPKLAIDGGSDGLKFHKIIIDQARKYLKRNGTLILENEVGQSDVISRLLVDSGYKVVKVYKNHKNEERVIVADKIT